MRYSVFVFDKRGALYREIVKSKSHRQALMDAGMGASAVVLSKSGIVKHYVGTKLSKIEPRFFKASRHGAPVILALVGNLPQFYPFENKEERDEVFACIESMSAASVETGAEPTDITAYFDVTYDSKSGSTAKKTSNGFAASAMIAEKLTRWNTVKSSGKGKSVASDDFAWSAGSNSVPSKSKSFLFAKVIQKELSSEFPSFNEYMIQKFSGKTIKVTQDKNKKDVWHCEGYMFLTKWLQFNNLELEIRGTPEGALNQDASLSFTSSMKNCIGTVGTANICNPDDPYPHYTIGGWCYAPEWLKVPGNTDKEKLVESKHWKYYASLPASAKTYFDPSAV